MPGTSFWISDDRSRAGLFAQHCPVIDSFVFAGVNSTPATVDVDISWTAAGDSQPRGDGDTVPETDPGAFSARFRRARAVGRIAGRELGFAFWPNGAATSDRGFAEFGLERNGSFL